MIISDNIITSRVAKSFIFKFRLARFVAVINIILSLFLIKATHRHHKLAVSLFTMLAKTCFVLIFCLACLFFDSCIGHGRLMDPPNRSSLWRFNPSAPINYDDDQNYCGGLTVSISWHLFFKLVVQFLLLRYNGTILTVNVGFVETDMTTLIPKPMRTLVNMEKELSQRSTHQEVLSMWMLNSQQITKAFLTSGMLNEIFTDLFDENFLVCVYCKMRTLQKPVKIVSNRLHLGMDLMIISCLRERKKSLLLSNCQMV